MCLAVLLHQLKIWKLRNFLKKAKLHPSVKKVRLSNEIDKDPFISAAKYNQ